VLPPDAYLIAFSSVYGHFGVAASGAYAVANLALEALVQQRAARGAGRSQVLAWSHWQDIGMSQGYAFREQSERLGFSMVDGRRGEASLLVARTGAPTRGGSGLDATRANVSRGREGAASRAVVAIAARSLPEWADVTLVQFRALVLLERDTQLNAGRLADFMGVSAPTATAMCDRLEAKLFGGCSFMSGRYAVGARNVAFAEKFLRDEGIGYRGGSVGGAQWRRI